MNRKIYVPDLLYRFFPWFCLITGFLSGIFMYKNIISVFFSILLTCYSIFILFLRSSHSEYRWKY